MIANPESRSSWIFSGEIYSPNVVQSGFTNRNRYAKENFKNLELVNLKYGFVLVFAFCCCLGTINFKFADTISAL